MQKWEYHTMFVWADTKQEGVKEYMDNLFPNWTNPPQYAPQSMLMTLNDHGAAGWELIHIEPVQRIGRNYDIEVGGQVGSWSHYYFCVFKRPVQEYP